MVVALLCIAAFVIFAIAVMWTYYHLKKKKIHGIVKKDVKKTDKFVPNFIGSIQSHLR